MLEETVCRNASPLAVEIDGTLAMLDVESGQYYTLDVIGADIWSRIETPQKVATLCGELAEIYDAPEDKIRYDVCALLTKLAEHDLVSFSGAETSSVTN